MRKFIAALLLGLILVGVTRSGAQEVFNEPYPLPFSPAPGDSTLPCENAGPPLCRTLHPGMWKCLDACGDPFLIIEYELEGEQHSHCENFQGDVYNCNGFGQP